MPQPLRVRESRRTPAVQKGTLRRRPSSRLPSPPFVVLSQPDPTLHRQDSILNMTIEGQRLLSAGPSSPMGSNFGERRNSLTQQGRMDDKPVQQSFRRTAYIHLHSLMSDEVLLPTPQRYINAMQHLLVQVVAVSSMYDQLRTARARSGSFGASATSNLQSIEIDCLEVHNAELQHTLLKATDKMGQRTMEAMLWAWLHALLHTELKWRQELGRDQTMLCNHQSTNGTSQEAADTLRHRVECRLEDLQALRRVTLFTYHTLSSISNALLPAYCETEANHDAPPAYSSRSRSKTVGPAAIDASLCTPIRPPVTPSVPDRDQHLTAGLSDVQLHDEMAKGKGKRRSADSLGLAEDGKRAPIATDSVAVTRKATPSAENSPHKRQKSCSEISRASAAQQMPAPKFLRDDGGVATKSNNVLLSPLLSVISKAAVPTALLSEFDAWLSEAPLCTLRIGHRLERRHWSLAWPLSSIDWSSDSDGTLRLYDL